MHKKIDISSRGHNFLILTIMIIFFFTLLHLPDNLLATEPELNLNEDDDSMNDLLDMSALDDEASFLASIPISSTGSLITRRAGEDPCNVIVITSEEIKNMGATTVSDALKAVPGVYVNLQRKGFDSVWMRGIAGSYNSKILMLVDGSPVRELVYGEGHFDEQFPIHLVRQIEVVKGPVSAIYGANALSGVVNIITKDNSDIGKGQVELTLGDQKTMGTAILTGNSTADRDIFVAASYYKSDGYNHPGDD